MLMNNSLRMDLLMSQMLLWVAVGSTFGADRASIPLLPDGRLVMRAPAIRMSPADDDVPLPADIADAITPLERAVILNRKAEELRAAGRYASSEPLYQQAILCLKKTRESEGPNMATILNNLAELHSLRGEAGKAELLYQRSAAILERVLGARHPDLATCLNNWAQLLAELAHFHESEQLYQRALAIWRQVPNGNNLGLASGLDNLAELYRLEGRYVEAEAFYQQALRLR